MKRIAIVFTKELIDNLRDDRSIWGTLGYALFTPALILLLIVVMGRFMRGEADKALMLPVAGRENAPALVLFLEQNNVILQDAPINPQEAVQNGEVDIVLVIPDDYGENFSTGQPAAVQIIADNSRTAAIPNTLRAQGLITQYGQQIGALRLLARGINPSIVYAVVVEEVNVATPQSQSLVFLNMLPYFLVMVVFLGGAAVIIDTTAGERERNSLEPLLINPIKRWEVVLGKLLASLPFATTTILVALGGFAAVFNLFPIEHFMGVQVSVDIGVLVAIFFVCLPMMLLAGALQMIIATFTHTYKEAQNYVNWLPLFPALPGLLLAFMPVKATVQTMLIPLYSQQVLINQLLRGESVTPLNVIVSIIATLGVSLILILIAIRLYNREEILFGKK